MKNISTCKNWTILQQPTIWQVEYVYDMKMEFKMVTVTIESQRLITKFNTNT